MSRLLELDVIRALAIFLVVFGHALCRMHQAPTLVEVIYSFHMPVLFTLSGLVIALAYARHPEPVNRLRRSARRLLVPYVLCGALFTPAVAALTTGNWKGSFIESWTNAFCTNHALWYLSACFLLICTYVAFEWLDHRLPSHPLTLRRLGLCLALAAMVAGLYALTRIDFLRSVLSYWFSFYVGVFLARRPELVTQPPRLLAGLSFLVWLALVFVFVRHSHTLIGNLVKLLTGLSALFPLAYLAHLLTPTHPLPTSNLQPPTSTPSPSHPLTFSPLLTLVSIGTTTLAVYCADEVLGGLYFRLLSPGNLYLSALYSLVFVLVVHSASQLLSGARSVVSA